RALQVVAPRDRGLRVGRVGKVRRIMDAGAVLLDRDLAVEVGRHAVEIRDHAFDLRNAAPLLVDLEFSQANERLTRLHRLVLPRSLIRTRQIRASPGLPGAKCGSTTLVFGFRMPKDLLKPAIR